MQVALQISHGSPILCLTSTHYTIIVPKKAAFTKDNDAAALDLLADRAEIRVQYSEAFSSQLTIQEGDEHNDSEWPVVDLS